MDIDQNGREQPTIAPPCPIRIISTPAFSLGTTNTDWTYANRTFVMPDGFPNVELSHWYSVTS